MTAEKAVQSAARRKRVQRLKRLIILSLMTAILTPTVLCVILFTRLHILEKQIDRLETAVADMQEEQTAVQAAGTNFGFSEAKIYCHC